MTRHDARPTDLNELHDALRRLYARLGRARVESFARPILPEPQWFIRATLDTASLGRAARLLAAHFQLERVPIDWSFDAAGPPRITCTRGLYHLALPVSREAVAPRLVSDLALGTARAFLAHSAVLPLDDAPACRSRPHVLAEVASLYLGLGPVLFDSRVRRDATPAGALSLEHAAYVLARRAQALADLAAPAAELSDESRSALRRGTRAERRQYAIPPLAGASALARLVYRRRRDLAERQGVRTTRGQAGYSFVESPEPLAVFACPRCTSLLRVQVRVRKAVKCTVCQTSLDCVS